MKNVVIMRHMVDLLRVVRKIALVLKVDPMGGTQVKVKENQEAYCSLSLRRK
jgi:hypothetical protein